MTRSDVAIRLAKRLEAAHGERIGFTGLNVMFSRQSPFACLRVQPGKAIMRLREARCHFQQGAVRGNGGGRGRRFQRHGTARKAHVNSSRCAVGCGLQDRSVGLEIAIVRPGDDEDRQRAQGFTVGGDRLHPAWKSASRAAQLIVGADGPINKLASDRGPRQQTDTLPSESFQDQAANRRAAQQAVEKGIHGIQVVLVEVVRQVAGIVIASLELVVPERARARRAGR